ncbi:MAG: DUF1841 family protein [Myxococcales bacterium]|nr:DUF1841 family protein [Myxococcales bacterium]
MAHLTWPFPAREEAAGDDDDDDDELERIGTRYDGETDPDPEAWRKAGDDDNRLAIERHHRRDRPHDPVPSLMAHSVMHLLVENEIAANNPPETRRALERLRAGGLSRHDAIHAIAAVLAEEMFGMLQRGREPDLARYGRALEALDAESWKAGRISPSVGPDEPQGSPPRRKRKPARRRR